MAYEQKIRSGHTQAGMVRERRARARDYPSARIHCAGRVSHPLYDYLSVRRARSTKLAILSALHSRCPGHTPARLTASVRASRLLLPNVQSACFYTSKERCSNGTALEQLLRLPFGAHFPHDYSATIVKTDDGLLISKKKR
jgi:hypothetical protein